MMQTERGGRLPAGDSPLQSRYYIRMSKPTWMRILLGANIAVFLLMTLFGIVVYGDWNGTQNMRVLLFFGAKVNQLIAQGQVWRLFNAMFIHIGLIHLLFNLYALYILGPLVEGFFGHRRFLLIYLIGGLWGSVASYAFSQSLSAGASGAIFGLAGATTVYFLRYRENFGARGRAIVQNMLVVIGINIVFGLSMPGIDNWGHMGGLLGGAAMAYGLLPIYRAPAALQIGAQPLVEEHRTTVEWLWVLGHIALLALAVQQISGQYL
ncbi:MAG: rhomboid family intramembrane serine protease [Caldilineaceae bacterium]|nr:rhomboid family intramembrane serine protease [Caldilineaceae bacterium]